MMDDQGVVSGASQLILPPDRHLRLYRCRGEARRAGDCDIIFGQWAYQRIVSHLAADTTREHGGLLLGYVLHSADATPQTVVITNALPAQATQGTPVSLTFTEETWLIFHQQTDTLEKLGGAVRRIGWYHSHPNLGIFLSHYDLDVCSNFNRADQVALVVDPVQDLGGFFVNGEEGYRQRVPQGFREWPDVRAGSVVTWRNMREVRRGELMPVHLLWPEPSVEELAEEAATPLEAEVSESPAPEPVGAEPERPPDESPAGDGSGQEATSAQEAAPADAEIPTADTSTTGRASAGQEKVGLLRRVFKPVARPFVSMGRRLWPPRDDRTGSASPQAEGPGQAGGVETAKAEETKPSGADSDGHNTNAAKPPGNG